jgi:hypothetical protein
MKRLRDQPSSHDPLIARAAFLLSAVPPLDTAPIQRRPLPAHAKARTSALQMRVAMTLAVSFASAVAGAATLHRTGWFHSFAATEATAPGPSLPSASTTGPATRGAASAAPSAAPVPSASAMEVEARRGVAALPLTRATASTAHATPAGASRASTPLADESALVVDAVRALRRDRDPRRAAKLAQEALQRYPQGAQVEEATAIAMEAAFAEGDLASAGTWAERYLSTFATGRFADRAKQLLSASPR